MNGVYDTLKQLLKNNISQFTPAKNERDLEKFVIQSCSNNFDCISSVGYECISSPRPLSCDLRLTEKNSGKKIWIEFKSEIPFLPIVDCKVMSNEGKIFLDIARLIAGVRQDPDRVAISQIHKIAVDNYYNKQVKFDAFFRNEQTIIVSTSPPLYERKFVNVSVNAHLKIDLIGPQNDYYLVAPEKIIL